MLSDMGRQLPKLNVEGSKPFGRSNDAKKAHARRGYRPDDPLRDANNPDVIIEGNPHIGHKPQYQFSVWEEKAREAGMTQKQFNELMNDSKKYHLEDPMENRSHRWESPDRARKQWDEEWPEIKKRFSLPDPPPSRNQ